MGNISFIFPMNFEYLRDDFFNMLIGHYYYLVGVFLIAAIIYWLVADASLLKKLKSFQALFTKKYWDKSNVGKPFLMRVWMLLFGFLLVIFSFVIVDGLIRLLLPVSWDVQLSEEVPRTLSELFTNNSYTALVALFGVFLSGVSYSSAAIFPWMKNVGRVLFLLVIAFLLLHTVQVGLTLV